MTPDEARMVLRTVVKHMGIYQTMTYLAEVVRLKGKEAENQTYRRATEGVACSIERARDTIL